MHPVHWTRLSAWMPCHLNAGTVDVWLCVTRGFPGIAHDPSLGVNRDSPLPENSSIPSPSGYCRAASHKHAASPSRYCVPSGFQLTAGAIDRESFSPSSHCRADCTTSGATQSCAGLSPPAAQCYLRSQRLHRTSRQTYSGHPVLQG